MGKTKCFYRDFEDTFRGPSDVIKERLAVYREFVALLATLPGPCEALDLGCGRGEWLEILASMGVRARGVDQDEGMVDRCRDRGLSVFQGDAIASLRGCPNSSLAAITGFHIAEHLPFADIQELAQEALRALRPGGLLILETPNPDNIISASSGFFVDPTHLRPLPDVLLKFVMDYYGFARTKVLRLQESTHLYDADRMRLADVLGGASPDYGVIAQKAADPEVMQRFDGAFAREHGISTADLSARYDAYHDRMWLGIARDANLAGARVQNLEAQLVSLREEVRGLEARFAGPMEIMVSGGTAGRMRSALAQLSRLTPGRVYRGLGRRAKRVGARLRLVSTRRQTAPRSSGVHGSADQILEVLRLPALHGDDQSAPRRLLIVRGDLNSWSGYGRAVNLYVGRLKEDFDYILGVDVHAHPATDKRMWPHMSVGDEDIAAILTARPWDATILTISTPDHFRRWFGAKNIGLFFWETARIDRPEWISIINTMDEIWAPAPFMVSILKKEGVLIPIDLVPCPLRPASICRHSPSRATRIVVQELSRNATDRVGKTTLEELRASASPLFLTTNSFIPRKGFAVLFQEWFKVAQRYPDAALLVKVGALDVNETPAQLRTRVESLAAEVARQHDLASTRIYVYVGPLEPDGMEQLTELCDAVISASFGEGLGLGIFENLLADKPVICPRHTSFADYLPEDYPYFLETDIANVGLPDPANVYPISAQWGIPREGALLEAVERLLADLHGGRLARVVKEAKGYFGARCGIQWARDAS